MDRKKVELLAPAGTYECFAAAMNAGADAVYLGLDRFSARAGAGNFTEDELLRALDTAHILGRKIYLTLNTLLRDDEIGKLYDMLKRPYEHGLDGIIVQDIGVMSYIHSTFPYLPIHASTQAAITTAEGAAFLEPLGIKRIVPARELSLHEIKLLKEKSSLEIECFIHGSLCYSYSGKCLMSSFIGGRSGNRGRCAQPCRLMYNNTYPLSLKDLCTIDILPALIDAGISSFKIEGRMKSSDYVYGVTSMYRKYIDSFYMTGRYRVSDDDRQKLISYYTRSGNCEGFYQTHNSRDMITYDSPSYSSSDDAKAEDRPAKVPVMIKCMIRKDQPVVITVSGKDESVTVTTDVIPEAARNAALTAANVEKQLKKTGNTLFTVERSEIDVDDGLFIPNGSLNEIRRRGLDALSERILAPYLREPAVKMPPEGVTVGAASGRDTDKGEYPEVRAGVLEISQAEAVLHSAARSIILPMALFDMVYERYADDLLKHDIYIRLPYVVRDESYKNSCSSITSFIMSATKKCDIKGFYVSDAAEVVLLRNCGYTGSVIADIHMYAYNNAAYDHLLKSGITKTTVPTELNLAQLRDRKIKGEELIIYGRSLMMISANCAYNTLKGCNRREKDAAYFNSIRLDDRKGEQFYVFCDCTICTNTIYNCVPLLLADHEEAFKVTAPSSLRFEFTDETGPQVRGILDKYYDSRVLGGSCTKKLTDRFTRGHIKRGVE